MISRNWRWFSGALLLIGVAVASVQTELQSRASALVTDFMAQKFDKVEEKFSSSLRSELPESKLYGVWLTIKSQFGEFKSIEGTRQEELPDSRIVVVTCRFTHTTWDVKVAFDPKGRVSGFLMVPQKSPAPSKPEERSANGPG